MNDFLRKIKILDTLTIELDIHKIDFINKFRNNVDESDLSLSDSFFEGLTSSKNEYKGNINDKYFNLRRRRKFFDTNKNFAIAKGDLVEKNNKLILNAEINGFHKAMKMFYLFIIFIYIIFILVFSVTSIKENNFTPFAFFPFIILHALFMLGIPYFIMRRSVTRMKYDLERDFHFWIK